MATNTPAGTASLHHVTASMSKRHRHKAMKDAKTIRNKARADEHARSGKPARTALVLGGGAPNMALMAGAVAAFHERGVVFDVVSTSGAGSLAGLLWLAPKGMSPEDALHSVTTMSISDAIYDHFPVNYKVFQKAGVWADLWRNAMAANPFFAVQPKQYMASPLYALTADWMALWAATLCPNGLGMNSWGLCAPTPFVEHIIDFDKIKHIEPHFYLNAYNITKEVIDDFTKDEITPDHFRAALAFPLIYGPNQLNGDLYYEGAVVDCLNFKDLVEQHDNLETIVVLDVLGSSTLIRKPRNLYDFMGPVDDHSFGENSGGQYRSVRLETQRRLEKDGRCEKRTC